MTALPPDQPPTRADQLVRAAFGCLAERGFEGLRMRDVAAAVGVNIATLHYYFRSKEDLVRSVVGYTQQRFRTTMADETAADPLRTYLEDLQRMLLDEPELVRVLGEIAQRAHRDPAIAAVLDEVDVVWSDRLAGMLRQGIAAGVYRDDLDPAGTAAVVMTMIKGASRLPAGGPHRARLQAAFDQVLRWVRA